MDGSFSNQYGGRGRSRFEERQAKQQRSRVTVSRNQVNRKLVNQNFEDNEFQIDFIDLMDEPEEDTGSAFEKDSLNRRTEVRRRNENISGRKPVRRGEKPESPQKRVFNRKAGKLSDRERKTADRTVLGKTEEDEFWQDRTLDRKNSREISKRVSHFSQTERDHGSFDRPGRESLHLSDSLFQAERNQGGFDRPGRESLYLSDSSLKRRIPNGAVGKTAYLKEGLAKNNFAGETQKIQAQTALNGMDFQKTAQNLTCQAAAASAGNEYFAAAMGMNYSSEALPQRDGFRRSNTYQGASVKKLAADSIEKKRVDKWNTKKGLTKEEWLRKRKQEVFLIRFCVICSIAFLLSGAGYLIFKAFHVIKNLNVDEAIEELADNAEENEIKTRRVKIIEEAPDFSVQLLTVNEYSRPAIPTEKIENIVVHYTANPGTTAQQNRDFFESLKDTHETSVSSHFVIGIDGEIIQCIPTKERAYASNNRNYNTVSIENCHLDKSGRFTQETYDSLVALSAWLCGKFDLTPDDIIRHYDVTGKVCPKYYVENEGAWELFKEDVRKYIEKYGVEKEVPVDEDYLLKNKKIVQDND